MKQTLINFIKDILPSSWVEKIRAKRKERRLRERFSINQGEDLLMDIIIGERKFFIYINPYLNGGVDDDIYHLRSWEPEIGEMIEKYLPIGGVFVDIGANIGYHSLHAAQVVGDEGQVLAFEPLPRLVHQIKNSLNKNNTSNVAIYNTALSDKIGQAVLLLVSENIGASSIQAVEHQRAVDEKVTIKLDLLDNYIDNIERLDLIKIDIEGSEYEALKGAEKILRKFTPIIILEFSPGIYEQSIEGKTQIFYDYLSNLGYKMFVIGREEINLEEKIRNRDFKDLHTNLLCVPAK